jgi:type I restriction enzyme M protein
MQNTEQIFLNELDDKLWKAADKLRSNLDAANYKHIVLGLRLAETGQCAGCVEE